VKQQKPRRFDQKNLPADAGMIGFNPEHITIMVRVERHHIKGTEEIIRLCTLSKELYNRCNFLMRQAFFAHERLPSLGMLVHQVQAESCFQDFGNTKVAKQTIRQVLTDWTNFFKALRVFKTAPSKFRTRPRPPHYKDQLAQVTFYSETIRRKPLRDGIIRPTNDCFEIRSEHANDLKQVMITPKSFGFIIEVQFEVPTERTKSPGSGTCCIDIGVNNLLTVTSDQHSPILVSGRQVKSWNRWFNKRPNGHNSRKRYFRIENHFHHVSKWLIRSCQENGIGTIIIGRNEGWKDGMNLGKRNNQNFQYIPFHLLLQKIEYKAADAGIKVLYTEESYTSKASFLDRDPLDGSIISGRRVHRGLYRASDGRSLNADVNGSCNIGRKVFRDDDDFIVRLDRSLAARPERIDVLKVFSNDRR